jgi:hypothetical protein
MEKTMYALVYTYEGYFNSEPYSVVIAVSNDEDKLIKEMKKCVTEDMIEDTDDEYNEERNFIIQREMDKSVILNHKYNQDLFIKYEIQIVDVL